MKEARDILMQYWGFSGFRSKQEEIIASVLDQKDTVALLPTGGGKTLCFQIPALVQEGICIVVSPLIALMGDQVLALEKRGIKALRLTGGISYSELNALLDNALYGNYKFLYLSPERLQQEIVQNYIRQMEVSLIAVDEAHCISQWGNDFRPSYRNIAVLRELHPQVPVIALTATATAEVLEDTLVQLGMKNPAVFKDSFVRKNLSYQVRKEEDKLYRLENLLKNNAGSAIVYVRSRKDTVEISSQLNSLGISATYFHGGLATEDKNKKLKQWRNYEVSTMVATNAFGMGIDHPDVRFVIHLHIPYSPEDYFQESGRAGRDGEPATAALLYNDYDIQYVKNQYIASLPGPDDLKEIYRKLNSYFKISYGEGEFTRHSFNFSEFCRIYEINTLLAFNALNNLDRLGIIQMSQEFGRKSIVRFIIPSRDLLDYFESDLLTSIIGKTILRMYGGVFEVSTSVNLDLIASKTRQSVKKIIAVLKKMERDGVLELQLRITDSSLTFLVPREDDRTINRVVKEAILIKQRKKNQVQAILRYLHNETECRSVQLVSYFGEKNASRCGICSVCRFSNSGLSKKEARILAGRILTCVQKEALSSRQLVEKLNSDETRILEVLRLLSDSGRIRLNAKNEFYIS